METPRVILIHGWLGSSEWWDEVTPRLDSRFEVETWEIPGFGTRQRDPIASRWMFDEVVSDLIQTLHARGGQVVLVGHSIGGTLALSVAARARNMVAGVVAIGSAARYTRSADWDFGSSLEEMAPAFASARDDFITFLCDIAPSLWITDDEPERAQHALKVVRRAAVATDDPDQAVSILEKTYVVDIREELSSVVTPVLLLHGANDQLAPPAVGSAMQGLISDSSMEIIDGTGHLLILTRPEEVALRINRFFGERLG